MKLQHIKTAVVMFVSLSFVLACGQFSNTSAVEKSISTATPTTAVATNISPAAVIVPDISPTVVVIQHKISPMNLPAKRSNHAEDVDSSINAANKIVTGGDRFTFGRFERPFNANQMDIYYPQLDIIDTYIFQDETWIYGTIKIKGTDSNNMLTGKYAIEFDLDRDGRGDWLIIAFNPTTTDWSVNAVQVYRDANKDVGSVHPMVMDEKSAGDGFETLFFDAGNGADPDAAWARVSPSDASTVEIAVKRSVFDNPERYMVNMWAGSFMLDPALFDINDHFTHEQAGEANPGFQIFYPIKQVSELDNSCRMAVGFVPTGQEPGLCGIAPEESKDPEPSAPCSATGANCP